MVYKKVETDLASIKPFRLVKFFTFTGLVVVFFCTLSLSWVISHYAKKVLLDRSDAYAMVMAENLNHQVFQQFVLPTILRYRKIALRNPKQYERLDAVVRNTIHGLNVQSVTIFDSQENVISYSTVKKRIGRKGVGKSEYKKALLGEENSVFVTKGSLYNFFPGADPIFCRLTTYIPFRQEKMLSKSTDQIMGVIEIVQDLSTDLEAIVKFQGTIIVTSIVIMSTLFVALGIIVARADRIIEARARVRRRLEEKLNHAERLAGLGKMIATVSHEIKNPLGIVRSTAEILDKRMKRIAPENARLAEIIIEETSRLDGIVREFLDFARPQVPRLSKVAVGDVLKKIMGFMEPHFAKSHIEVETDLNATTPVIDADPDLLYRVYLNIIINAVQAMPDGGRLTVRCRPRGTGKGKIVTEISDTGTGMSPEVQEQIFTPFFTEKTRGTGLGLAIAENIIGSHNGTISVDSERGKGTTFRITLG